MYCRQKMAGTVHNSSCGVAFGSGATVLYYSAWFKMHWSGVPQTLRLPEMDRLVVFLVALGFLQLEEAAFISI